MKGEPAVAAALAAGATVAEAAEAGGVSERTIYRRLTAPAYVLEVRQLRAALLSRAAGRLAELAPRAAETLGDLLGHAASDPQTARLAAVAVLEQGSKLASLTDLETRLAELEAKVSTS